MKVIDNDTKITGAAISFMDGAHGYFRQEYKVMIDGEYSGVNMVTERRSKNTNSVRVFLNGIIPHDSLKAALPEQKFKWLRDSKGGE